VLIFYCLNDLNKKFCGVQGHASRFSKEPLAAGGKELEALPVDIQRKVLD
jgi:hypothetical protein